VAQPAPVAAGDAVGGELGFAVAVQGGGLGRLEGVLLMVPMAGALAIVIRRTTPELVTVVQSAHRRETDLIVGNLLGSNLFNALAVGGLIGLIGATGVDDARLTALAATSAFGAAVVALAAMRSGRRVLRLEGGFLVAGHAVLVPFLARDDGPGPVWSALTPHRIRAVTERRATRLGDLLRPGVHAHRTSAEFE
jgi:hypothetical protein